MAKRQTRRSISVKGLTYQRLKKHCDEYNSTREVASHLSISGFVETLIHKKLDELGAPEETVLAPRPLSERRGPAREDIVSQHFTF